MSDRPSHQPHLPAAAYPPTGSEIRIVEPLCAVFRRRLRDVGLKYTAERARILDAVIAMPGPFRVEELIASLRGGLPRVSKATAYRTIHLLQECGIVQPIPLAAEEQHYQLAYGRGPSAIFIRTDTQQVEQAALPELIELCRRAAADRGLRLDGQQLVIYCSSPAPAEARLQKP